MFFKNYPFLEGQHKIKSHNVTEEGKITRIYEDGRKELIFPHGVRREVFRKIALF